MATNTTTIKFVGQFDSSGITKGLQDIKKQVTNANISEELKKQFEDAFKKLEVNIPALEKLTSKEDFNLKDIEALQKLLKEVTKDWENLNKVTDQIDLSKTFSAKDLEKINNLDKQIKQTQDNIQKARKELVDSFSSKTGISISSKNVSNALTELFTVKPNEIELKFKEIQTQFNDGVQKTQLELENKLKGANIQKTSSQIIEYFFGKDSGVEFAAKVGPIRDQLNEIIRTYREAQKKGDIAGVAEQVQKLNEVLTNTANFKFPEGYQLFGLPTQEDLNTLNSIGEVLKKVKELAEGKEVFFTEEETKLAQLFEQRINSIAIATKNASENQGQFIQNLNNTSNGIKNFINKTNSANEELLRLQRQGEALEQTFGSLVKRIENSVSALAIFNKSTQIIQKAINSVKDLDAAFTQIAIVSGQSGEAAWKMFDSFNSLAKQYSITTKDLTEGAKLFYQQGLNAADTMKMVEASTISAALGEVSMTEAANTLTAAIQGYNESAAVAMDYTDKIAMVGAVSAADFNELSAAMEKTASSAYTAGIDFDHLLGYLGKMIEVTREAPANLGTAMKTIIARFEDMKKDPMAILEDGVSANKVEAALATIGIALRDSSGEFRALQDVFDELGMKWQSLTRNQQAYIATVAAGSRQQSRFLAMMNNYDRTLDLITESQNSAGAAAEQYATYQDSVAAAQARLTVSWEKFYSKIVDNDLIKIGINSLTKLIDILSKIPPGITAIGAALGALQLQNLFKIITSSKNGFLSLTDQFKHLYKMSKSTEVEWDTLVKVSPRLSNVFSGVKTSIQGVTTSLFGAIRASAAFIVQNKWWFIAGALIAATILTITYALGSQKREYEKLTRTVKKYNEVSEEYNEKSRTGKELLDSYEELTSKINRTNEEQIQLNETIKQISEIFPTAITYMDEYGNMHLQSAKAIHEEVNESEKLYKQNKRLALQTAKTLLKKQSQRVKKEDLANLGIDNQNTKRFFEYREKAGEIADTEIGLKPFFANTLLGLSTTKKIGDTPLPGLGALEKITGLNFLEKIPSGPLQLLASIQEINTAIDLLGIDVEKLDTLTDGRLTNWEDIFNKKEEIKKYREETHQEMLEYGNVAKNSLKILQKDLNIEYSFLDLNFNDKKGGVATGQKAIAAKLKEYFSSMSDKVYIAFTEKLEGKKIQLSDFIQDALNKVDTTDEAIEVGNLIDKVLDPENYEKDLTKDWERLGVLCDDAFRQGLEEAQEEQKKEYRNNLENTIRDQFELGQDFSLKDYTNSQLVNMNELGRRGIDDFETASKLESFYAEGKELAEKAARTGAINGLNKAFEDINKDDLDDNSKEQLEEVFVDLIDEATYTATQDAFDKLQQQSIEFVKKAKKSLSSIQSEGKISAEDYGLENKDYSFGVYFDPISGEKMISTARVLLDTEKENNKQLEETKKTYQNNLELINKIESKGKNITQEERKQLENLYNENEALAAQYKYFKKISNISLESGWNTSIQLAKNYQSQLQTISELEKSMSEQGGILFLDDMEKAMSILPEFQNRFTEVSDNTYTISAENIEAMKKEIKSQYDLWLAQEKAKATVEYENAVANYELINTLAKQERITDTTNTEQFIKNNEDELKSTKIELEQTLNANYDEIKQELNAHSEKDNQMVQMFDKALLAMGSHYEDFVEDIKSGNFTPIYNELYKEIESPTLSTTTEIQVKTNLLEILKDPSKSAEKEKIIKAALEEASQRVRAAWKKLTSLKEINVPELDKLKHQLEEAAKGGKEAEDGLEALADTINNLLDVLKDLDDLLKNIKEDLADISVDYNPFTDLFEAWEHEWDYYYNIKRLIQEIGTQGQFIDNIISADYTSADQKVKAYHAKVGNLLAQMGANDAYIETLRAGMTQTGVELMKEFGEYYKIDPTTGQIYQHDISLNEINNTINQRREEIYELQKLKNEQENNLNLENAKLDALDKEKSAYEDILSTIESQIDSLESNEDITVDISKLQSEQASIKAKIEVTESSISEAKNTIQSIEDDIQEIEVDITLKEQNLSKLEEYVDKMENKVSEYEEYWENLNSTIAEQQELLQSITEIYNEYVDTAISTEQELYNAIVENYQKEINEKKKQYDYLKQLDKDYLQSIKDNISEERKAREDSNKQKSYQQSLQRAQLLQMDTSGAYRAELANLNKEIENQREELYDDLVDKQVEALEKEIDKRHELYDKEVTALEERLAYMQENAILLWEIVNNIVAEGAESMMALLENTTEYINSNELSKQQQRNTWEKNVKMTFDGVKEGTIDMLQGLIEAGNKYIVDELPEVEGALDNYTLVFEEAAAVMSEYNNSLRENTIDLFGEEGTFKTILNAFMTSWNNSTNALTGYTDNWEKMIQGIREATEKNIKALEDIANEGGSIKELDEKLRESAQEMYDDFIAERERYRDELESLIGQIQSEISAAISDAAEAIRSAAGSIQINPEKSGGSAGDNPGGGSSEEPGATNPNNPVNPPSGITEPEKKKKYKADIVYYLSEEDMHANKNMQMNSRKIDFDSYSEAEKWASETVIDLNALYYNKRWYRYFINSYKKGGLADFTGPAWLDGTKSKPERVLSPKQTKLFESMVSSLEKASNNSNINSTFGSSYNIGDINTTVQVDKLDNQTDINKLAKQVEDKIVKTIRNRVTVSINKGV